MKTKRFFRLFGNIIACFVIQIEFAFSQEINFINISKTQNLPSLETYNVFQDRRGYIWIGTENGLVKYSLNSVKVFDKQNGLNENSVYYLNENSKGEIEILTSANRFLTIKDDIIKENFLSKKIKEGITKPAEKDRFNLGYLINKISDNKLLVNSRLKSFEVKNGYINDLTGKYIADKNANFIIHKENLGSYFIRNKVSFDVLSPGKTLVSTLYLISKNKVKPLKIVFDINSGVDWRNRVEDLNQTTYFTLHNLLLKIDKNLNVIVYTYPTVITSLYTHPKHGLWVGTASNGVYHYPNPKNMNMFSRGLKGLTVSGILVDKENGTWCTTIEKGVFYSSNYSLKHFSGIDELNKKTTLLKSIGSKTFIATEIDNLQILENNRFKSIPLLGTGNAEIVDIIKFKNIFYLGTKGYLGIFDDNFKINGQVYFLSKKSNSLKTTKVTTYQFDTTKNNLYVLTPSMILKVKHKLAYQVGKTLNSKSKCFKVVNDSIAYVGCIDGLYSIEFEKNKLKKFNLINSPVSKIIQINDGSFLIATRGQGIYRLSKGYLTKIDIGIKNYILNDLVEDNSGIIWLSTSNGIINLSKVGLNQYKFLNLNESNGLISNNIGHISISNNQLLISSTEGIGIVPVTAELINREAPKIILNKILINNIEIKHQGKHLRLKHTENSLLFTFDFLSYKNGKEEKILYRLEGIDTYFKSSKTNQIIYDNLPSDAYKLVVFGVNNDGLKSKNPIVVRFTIEPAFWQTKGFLIAVILLVMLVVFIIFQKIIYNIKKKEEERTNIQRLISDSQLKALQSQMNPHFIFNAINSIQNYILNRKEIEAYNYLNRFSKLIRMVLINSREIWVTLNNELEILKLYVELEKLRFPNSFDFKINIDQTVDVQRTEIPTAFLQIFIENSIWHGIMNLDMHKKGLIQLIISKSLDTLKIVIEDNGVGREKSKEYLNNNYKTSLGLKLIDEKIKIINEQITNKIIQYQILDLEDTNGNSIGTRVEVFILEK